MPQKKSKNNPAKRTAKRKTRTPVTKPRTTSKSVTIRPVAPALDPVEPPHDPTKRAFETALVALIEKSVRGLDQKLDYHGRDRFVLFYYEPRGEEVIWRDSYSYGFATGAGQLFIDELEPVADLHKVDVGGDGSPGTHVLLIDRVDRRAYFVEKNEAIRFLTSIATQRESDSGKPDEVAPLASLATLVEITQGSIRKLAYNIWEKNGRLEGRALQDWLQAEAQLRAERWASWQSK